MIETLMFNPNTLAQLFVSSADANNIGKLKDQGYLQNPRLVAMYSPDYKKDVMIPVQDRKTWEAKGYFAEPTMIYHPKDGTQKVSAEDSRKAVKNGWYLSPAYFPGNSEGAIKTPNVMKEAV